MEMKRAYTKQLYECIYKQMRIKPDPQVFLGMATRAKTVDTRPFFFLLFEWPGYEAKQGQKIAGTNQLNI